jgi:ParB-like chromosome segregation protein Spo0J
MATLKVADLLATLTRDQELHLDPQQVERYRHSIDRLPPLVVFDTREGPLLADGHHRLAAASAEGKETIEAEVRNGSRQDALAYAVAVGAAQRGLPAEDARRRTLDRYGRR